MWSSAPIELRFDQLSAIGLVGHVRLKTTFADLPGGEADAIAMAIEFSEGNPCPYRAGCRTPAWQCFSHDSLQ
jgi:hypothetical protein